jgi:peptidyl-tRNA hydrolase
MYVVVPRRPEGSREDLLAGAVRAVLTAAEEFGETEAWSAWSPRPRKVCLRGRPAEVGRVRALDHVAVGEVLCLPPRRRSEAEPELTRLQAHTGEPLAAGEAVPRDPGRALFLLDADLGMTFGKAAAQVGHAALALRDRDSGAAAAARDGALEVRLAEHAAFTRASREPGVACVHDAGLTEVAPGTVTALALAPQGVRPLSERGQTPLRKGSDPFVHALARPV